MNRKLLVAGFAAGATALSMLAVGGTGATASPSSEVKKSPTTAVRACAPVTKLGQMACDALVLADANGRMLQSDAPLPAAFTPADFQKAYNLKGLESGGRTVAIIDAYGYSTLEADLKVYRNTYGLPPCTTKNGCLTILDERGGHNYPPDDPGWDLEQALDVDMVSAVCPDCKIVVVQGKAPNLKSLGHAVNTAAKIKGVVAISNSYGGGDINNKPYYKHPGIAVLASTGDSGYTGGGHYPSSDSHVIAVGGTAIVADGSQRGYHETAWSGAGSACARRNPQPHYQIGVTSCDTDAAADISAAASPAQGGASVYYAGSFRQVGGTSESTPLLAGVYALSGNVAGYPGKYPYRNPKKLYDVTEGSNGSCGAPLCTAGKGWDGPTGLGTPNGIGAF